MANPSMSVKVDARVIVIEEKNKNRYTERLETLIKEFGLPNISIMSSGISYQGRAKDYWAIVAIVKTEVSGITT
jgi:hypothetical protein